MGLIAVMGLVAAVACVLLARRTRARSADIVTSDAVTVAELRQLHDAAARAAGPGYFRHRCVVAGKAQPAATGTLRADVSGADCVWHRHVVTRKYWIVERFEDASGRSRERREQRTERIAERESTDSFVVDDGTGQLPVRPANAVRHVALAVDRFEPQQEESRGPELSIGAVRLRLPSSRREGTIGYQYEEWLLKQGDAVLVLGDATDESGQLAVDEPTLISTKDEATLLREGQARYRLLVGGAVVAGVGGFACGLVALVS